MGKGAKISDQDTKTDAEHFYRGPIRIFTITPLPTSYFVFKLKKKVLFPHNPPCASGTQEHQSQVSLEHAWTPNIGSTRWKTQPDFKLQSLLDNIVYTNQCQRWKRGSSPERGKAACNSLKSVTNELHNPIISA